MPPSAGVRLGLYEILDAIGVDWMGEVYGARGTYFLDLPVVHQPELDCFCRGGHKFNGCPAHRPGTTLVDLSRTEPSTTVAEHGEHGRTSRYGA